MRWSERAPAAGPRSLSLPPFPCKPRAPSAPVAHLVLVRSRDAVHSQSAYLVDTPTRRKRLRRSVPAASILLDLRAVSRRARECGDRRSVARHAPRGQAQHGYQHYLVSRRFIRLSVGGVSLLWGSLRRYGFRDHARCRRALRAGSTLVAPSREPYYVGERYSRVVCTLP
jgi:hypothetical protein